MAEAGEQMRRRLGEERKQRKHWHGKTMEAAKHYDEVVQENDRFRDRILKDVEKKRKLKAEIKKLKSKRRDDLVNESNAPENTPVQSDNHVEKHATVAEPANAGREHSGAAQ